MAESKSHPELVTRCVADMTDKEREEFMTTLPSDIDAKRIILEGIQTGEIKKCPKTDWCRKAKEAEEAKKQQEVETLRQQNQQLTQLNEQQNNKINELQSIIVQHNELLAKIVARLPPA